MIVDLHLKGKLVIVVGGGIEALKKVESLFTQDCKILVVSDTVLTKIIDYKKQNKLKILKKKIKTLDFLSRYKPILIMACTDDKKLNKKIVMQAKKMKCYGYAVDDPSLSDFSHPSIINIEDTIQVAVSTGGQSPVMAKKIKLQVEKVLKKVIKPEDFAYIRLQRIARDAAKQTVASPKERKKYLYSIMNDSQIKQLIKDKNLKKAQQRAMLMLRKWQ